jgi:Na+:H+ antiporter, NhaA family
MNFMHISLQALRRFLQMETAGSILLLTAAVIALLMSNIAPLSPLYNKLLATLVEIRVGELEISKPLLLWINDGLMAIFFLLVSLELKREMLEGQLSKISQVILPVIAAIGGMLVPALIYIAINGTESDTLNGWAIPSATDIAFSLGVLALLGSRVPTSLKLFLMALAIIDDLGAILIIAFFYSGEHLYFTPLFLAFIAIFILFLLNYANASNLAVYLVVGLFLWVCILKSGLHATLTGVILAFFIPLRVKNQDHKQDHSYSPLYQLEHSLHPAVVFGVMPIFAFSNAGVSLTGLSLASLFEPIPLGIILGLFIGKQMGVLGFSWMAIRLGLARLPDNSNWWQLYAISVLCGIGFTMSLFIGSLAFTHEDYMNQVRLGVIVGSLASALLGYFLLRMHSK